MDSKTMFQRKWLWVSAIIIAVAAVVAAGVWVWQSNRPPRQLSDCDVARAMIDYNKTQGQSLANQFDPGLGKEASVADYQNWANQMQTYAARIKDPNVADHAHQVANDANKMVDLVKQARADTSVPADPQAPPFWLQPYAQLGKHFESEMKALDSACPKR